MKPKYIRTVHPKGWPVTFLIEPADPKLHELIQQLQKLGYRPDVSNEHVCQITPEGLPICPKHNQIMAKREKQGDVWFSHSVIDPSTGEKTFCRGYESKNSPGWSVDMPVK